MEDVNPVVSDQYFSELLSYPLERLGKEPELLRADQEALRRQLQDTAVANYRSFVGTARCLADLRAQLEAATGHLDSLGRDLPKLQAAAEAFRREAADIQAKRASNRQLYNTHATLLELLEVPQLMDTCIRSGNFDEALDLRAFVNKVAVVHGDLPVVKRLVAEVAAVSAAMLEQLLQRLQVNIQLPECLRVIGYLRRLAAFSERELRLQFLQRREAWVAGLVGELEAGGSAYELLKRLTDIYRLHLFDVVMQYRAIFSDDPVGPAAGASSAPTTPATPATPSGAAAGAAGAAAAAAAARDGGILYCWAQRRVVAYVEAVRLHLPRISEGGSLASVLDHAMYCGMSLGRVGMDFRSLLAPLFEARALEMFAQAVHGSTDALLVMLDTHKWIAMPTLAARGRTTSDAGGASMPTGAAADRGAGGDGAADAGDVAAAAGPPYALMEHLPLAVYTNGLLAAFNELRHCAPLSIREPVAGAVQESLGAAAGALARQGFTHSLSESERPVFEAACKAFSGTLCPYAAACLTRIFPGAALLLDLRAACKPLTELTLAPAGL
eukprot:scaffold3.g6351.t1